MKNNHYSQGSAHLILITVLVIGLVGALGYVFWQNFILKGQTGSTIVQSKPAVASPIAFTDWKASMSQPTTDTYTAVRVKADQVTGSIDAYDIYSKKTTAACPTYTDGSVQTIGRVTRMAADEQIPVPGSSETLPARDYHPNSLSSKVIGNYVYNFVGPQNVCGTGDKDTSKGDAATATQVAATKAFSDVFLRLVAQ